MSDCPANGELWTDGPRMTTDVLEKLTDLFSDHLHFLLGYPVRVQNAGSLWVGLALLTGTQYGEPAETLVRTYCINKTRQSLRWTTNLSSSSIQFSGCDVFAAMAAFFDNPSSRQNRLRASIDLSTSWNASFTTCKPCDQMWPSDWLKVEIIYANDLWFALLKLWRSQLMEMNQLNRGPMGIWSKLHSKYDIFPPIDRIYIYNM